MKTVCNTTVTILMATYNGAKFLREQLDSIINQSFTSWQLLVSDDGSTDETIKILNEYQLRYGSDKLKHLKGPQEGFVANFFFLIQMANTDNEFFAFADQDDVWQVNKLERAISFLNMKSSKNPALYCSRTNLINSDNTKIGQSALFKVRPHFKNALVQSIAGGNTMVFNKAALFLLKNTTNHFNVVSHDWWTYLLVSGNGGYVFYDTYPSVNYRQHDANVVGSNVCLQSQLERIKMLFKGRFKYWIDINLLLLHDLEHLLTCDNRLILEKFISARKSGYIRKVLHILRIGLYRQTLMGNIGLFVSILANKL